MLGSRPTRDGDRHDDALHQGHAVQCGCQLGGDRARSWPLFARTWCRPRCDPCSERYATSMVFPLERDGAMLTATDIQARTGGQDAGLLENLEIIPPQARPGSGRHERVAAKGLGRADLFGRSPRVASAFPGSRGRFKDKPAVCLSYKYPSASRLRFQSRRLRCRAYWGAPISPTTASWCSGAWRQGGSIGATNFMTLAGKKWKQVADRRRFYHSARAVGEARPGSGPQRARSGERHPARLGRRRPCHRQDRHWPIAPSRTSRITGVAADIFYSGDDAASRRPPTAKVLFSPFEIRWK